MTPGASGPLAGDVALPVGELRAAFDLGDWREVELLPAGKSQHHLVSTTLGRFVLRRSYRAKEADEVRFEHELVAYLRSHGFPAPEFVPTVAGEPSALVDGRLWRASVFVTAAPASSESPAQVEAVARTLARYHSLVDGFAASVAPPAPQSLPDALRERLDGVSRLSSGDLGPAGREAAATLAFALSVGETVWAALANAYARLPHTLIHAGCRRGSALFCGDRLVVMLDFYSAHRDLRAYDLAVAVHDFAKIYGDPASPDFKVHLDPAVKGRFLAAYHTAVPLAAGELEAIPVVLLAKRLKRALGRYGRLLAGEELSVNDHKKIALELARVRSLMERDMPLPVTAA